MCEESYFDISFSYMTHVCIGNFRISLSHHRMERMWLYHSSNNSPVLASKYHSQAIRYVVVTINARLPWCKISFLDYKMVYLLNFNWAYC